MKTLLTLTAFQYLNVPYMWGGQNYLGLDCSGFVLKSLSDIGYTLPDMTADDLYRHCLKHGISSEVGYCDSLLFFGYDDNITHTAISIGLVENEWLMIEAGGAGKNSLNMTKEELAQRDARVRIRPVNSRRDLIAAIKIPLRRE